jgi:F0F1-type ATP synthase assembly protein I
MERPGGGAGEEEQSTLPTLARYSGHGLTLALSMGLFLLAGWWLDGRVGTTPIFTITGALVGAAGGFYHMIYHLLLRPRERKGEGEDGRDDG